ncbi:DnaJ domain-containing protein [Maricaulis maris]|uniref:DnaJ domain-containing protein n=1 Tax=Maricaulis maris TaxID=74318 RepID=UPI003A942194
MTPFALGILALMALLGAAWWFSRQKTASAARMVRIILGGGALLAGAIISLRGGVILGGPIGLFGMGLLGDVLRPGRSGSGGGRTASPPSASQSMSVAEAREILGVDADADAAAIRAAHRRLMKKLHPDTGEGSAALARQVQEARDLLLANLPG